MTSIRDIGKKIYDLSNPREKRRYYVYLMRSILHKGAMGELIRFFEEDSARRKLLNAAPFAVEQATRAFFYNKSTFQERVELVKGHFRFLQATLQDKVWLQISDAYQSPINIWESEYEEQPWVAELVFEPGQRKEGLLSLELNLGKDHLYQIMFWLGYDKRQEPSLWIGAMQGPNMDGAKDIVKKMTKACHGYRTKNLILYMVQAMARAMSIQHIYAVSNYGYYANNHMRADRKLKTSFGDFWSEAGGHETEDQRFYEVPLQETRKTMEEVPTRKRAVYRRRFEFLDRVDQEIGAVVKSMLK